jgi:ketosteroid isomerase-like protein
MRNTVEKMFERFRAKNLEGVVELFSEDAVSIYHGTQLLPSAKFSGKEGAKMFFEFNFQQFDIVYFRELSYIVEGPQVVVLGEEHFKGKADQKDYKQKWVQVYTIESDLITRMEEFATSATTYGGNMP